MGSKLLAAVSGRRRLNGLLQNRLRGLWHATVLRLGAGPRFLCCQNHRLAVPYRRLIYLEDGRLTLLRLARMSVLTRRKSGTTSRTMAGTNRRERPMSQWRAKPDGRTIKPAGGGMGDLDFENDIRHRGRRGSFYGSREEKCGN